MTQTKALLVQVFLLVGIFSSVPVVSALAASSADPGEWGTRPAGGPRNGQPERNGEMPALPTVANCVERTGKTEDECKKMIPNFASGERPSIGGENRSERGQKSDEERSGHPALGQIFERLKERLEKVISFLDSKEVDTDELNSAFDTLSSKIDTATAAHEAYQTALATWKADQSDTNKEALNTARTTAQEGATAVKTYYHDTVLPLLKAALQSLR